MRCIALFFVLNFIAGTALASLPDWVRRDCELISYSHLTKHMKEENVFYRIKNIQSVEVESNGLISINTKLVFDDSIGCHDRQVEVACLPLDLGNSHALAYFITLTQCSLTD